MRRWRYNQAGKISSGDVKTKVKIKEYRDEIIDTCYGNHLIASYKRLEGRFYPMLEEQSRAAL